MIGAPRPYLPLQIAVPMTIQQGRSTWSPAIVVEKHEAPRSFKVKTEDGQILSSPVPRWSGSMIGRTSLMCSKRSRAYYWLEDNRRFRHRVCTRTLLHAHHTQSSVRSHFHPLLDFFQILAHPGILTWNPSVSCCCGRKLFKSTRWRKYS